MEEKRLAIYRLHNRNSGSIKNFNFIILKEKKSRWSVTNDHLTNKKTLLLRSILKYLKKMKEKELRIFLLLTVSSPNVAGDTLRQLNEILTNVTKSKLERQKTYVGNQEI